MTTVTMTQAQLKQLPGALCAEFEAALLRSGATQEESDTIIEAAILAAQTGVLAGHYDTPELHALDADPDFADLDLETVADDDELVTGRLQ